MTEQLWKCLGCREQDVEPFCHAHGGTDAPYIDAVPVNSLHGTADAAEYLKLSVAGLKYHVREGNLEPRLIGKTWVFTEAQLNYFLRTRRGPGRPCEEAA